MYIPRTWKKYSKYVGCNPPKSPNNELALQTVPGAYVEGYAV